jgi:hypothetical protein
VLSSLDSKAEHACGQDQSYEQGVERSDPQVGGPASATIKSAPGAAPTLLTTRLPRTRSRRRRAELLPRMFASFVKPPWRARVDGNRGSL